jgi:hypothetical protein
MEGHGIMADHHDGNYTGCAILVYDANSHELLARTVVSGHDKAAMSVELDMRLPFKNGTAVSVLILTNPVPKAYQGRLSIHGSKTSVAMHHGRTQEGRKSKRYNTNLPASLLLVVRDGQVFDFQPPFQVALVNISTTGVRIRAPQAVLSDGDIIQLQMMIGEKTQIMTAEVVFSAGSAAGSVYGCRFIAGLPA